jgi:hypothetical protein
VNGETPPTMRQGGSGSGRTTIDSTGAVRQNTAHWPEDLSDTDLKKLVAALDAGVAAAHELPGSMSQWEDLMYAAGVARIALRRRVARGRIATAREALRTTGWTP